MRHCPRNPETCQPYMPLTPLVLALLVAPLGPLAAQVAVSGGYTAQHLSSAGPHSGGVSGYTMDIAIRVGRKADLLLGLGQVDHDEDAFSGPRHVSSTMVGVHVLAARSRYVSLGLAAGVGTFGLDVDSEDHNSAGFAGFVQARLYVTPVSMAGVYVGGIMQPLGAVGRGSGGAAYGLTLGVQIRSEGW